MARPAKKVSYQSGMTKGELAAELSKVSRLANDRLRSLEKSGVKTFAYGTAKNYAKTQGRSTSRPRFSSGAGMTYNEMQKEYKQAVKFLKSESSTVTGMDTATQNMLNAFGEKFDISDLNKRQRNRLFKTLSEGTWRDVWEAYQQVASEEIIESLIRGVKEGMTIRELKNVLLSIEADMQNDSLDWADFDRRFTKYYAQSYEHF